MIMNETKLLQGLERLGLFSNSHGTEFTSDSFKDTYSQEKPNDAATKILSLAEKLYRYIDEIILFNSAYNLTNTSDRDQIAVNHVLDSLSAAAAIRGFAEDIKLKNPDAELTVADIGSGGGLPGIPLAAALSEFNFVLVERMDKRCSFLENQVALLGLSNVSVRKSEAERIPCESFDIVTFRAFRPLDKKMTKTLLGITKTGGTIAAYKAKKSSIIEEMNGISDLVPEYTVMPLEVPFLTDGADKNSRERNLVLIRK